MEKNDAHLVTVLTVNSTSSSPRQFAQSKRSRADERDFCVSRISTPEKRYPRSQPAGVIFPQVVTYFSRTSHSRKTGLAAAAAAHRIKLALLVCAAFKIARPCKGHARLAYYAPTVGNKLRKWQERMKKERPRTRPMRRS